MTTHEPPAEPDPRQIVVEPAWRRLKAPMRVVLRFGLRTVFAVLLLVCVALTVAYYGYFKTRSALQGPTLRIHANDTVSLSRHTDQPLSHEALAGVLERAMQRYRAAVGETDVEIDRAGWGAWDNPYGPPVTVIVDPQATHGALDSLLHACVDHGFERYLLTDATDKTRSFSFVLVKDRVGRGFPDPHELPPVILYMWAAEDGSLKRVALNYREYQSLAGVRRWLNRLIGPERGPLSIHDSIEVAMRCDTHLKIRHVLDAHEALAGYQDDDGQWVSLVERVRPVRWGTGQLDLDEMEWETKRFRELVSPAGTNAAVPEDPP